MIYTKHDWRSAMHYDLKIIQGELAVESREAASLLGVLLIGLKYVGLSPDEFMYVLGHLSLNTPNTKRRALYDMINACAGTRLQEPLTHMDPLWPNYRNDIEQTIKRTGDIAKSAVHSFSSVVWQAINSDQADQTQIDLGVQILEDLDVLSGSSPCHMPMAA